MACSPWNACFSGDLLAGFFYRSLEAPLAWLLKPGDDPLIKLSVRGMAWLDWANAARVGLSERKPMFDVYC